MDLSSYTTEEAEVTKTDVEDFEDFKLQFSAVVSGEYGSSELPSMPSSIVRDLEEGRQAEVVRLLRERIVTDVRPTSFSLPVALTQLSKILAWASEGSKCTFPVFLIFERQEI